MNSNDYFKMNSTKDKIKCIFCLVAFIYDEIRNINKNNRLLSFFLTIFNIIIIIIIIFLN